MTDQMTNVEEYLEEPERFPLWQPFTAMRGFLAAPEVYVRGEGIYLYDNDDRKYIDAAGGLWNMSCGLGNKKIQDAVQQQMSTLAFGSLFHRTNPVAIQLAAKLVELAPDGLNRAFLTNTGSESVEVAIKAIRSYFTLVGKTEKKSIVCLKRAYHGSYYGSGTASDNIPRKSDFEPNLPGVYHIEPPYCYRCPYGKKNPGCSLECADALEDIVKRENGTIAAFFMEPIMGSGGVIVPPREYHAKVEQICKENGVFRVMDEVATGFGKTGKLFASEWFDVKPDVMTLSKGINSGYLPIGAVLFTDEIYKPFWENNVPLQIGSTQDGNPICCASALAVIDQLENDGLVENAQKMGNLLIEGLHEIKEKSKHIGDVRGKGLMVGLELVLDKETKRPVEAQHISMAVGLLRRFGLLVYPNPCGISMYPPLVIDQKQVREILDILEKILIPLRLEM